MESESLNIFKNYIREIIKTNSNLEILEENELIKYCIDNSIDFSHSRDRIISNNLANKLSKLNKLNIRLSLKDIFSFEDQLIDDIISVSRLHCSKNRLKRCSMVSIFLAKLLIESDKKYVINENFFNNMVYILNFDEAISSFSFIPKSFSERTINDFRSIFGSSYINIFNSVVGNIFSDFNKEYYDINILLIRKIANLLPNEFKKMVTYYDFIALYKNLEGVDINLRYKHITNIANFISSLSENDIKISYQKYGIFISSLRPSENSVDDNIFTFLNLQKIIHLPNKLLSLAFNNLGEKAFRNNSIYLLSLIEKISDSKDYEDLFNSFLKLLKKLDDNFFGDNVKFLNFIDKFSINNTILSFTCGFKELKLLYEISRITTEPSFDIVYPIFQIDSSEDLDENKKYIISDEIYFYLPLIKCFRREIIPSIIFSSYLSLFNNIEYKRDKLLKNHLRLFTNDISDNFVFLRVARAILFEKMFDYFLEIKNSILSIGCNKSLFSFIGYDKLCLKTDIKTYYNQTVDVHDNDRDERTVKAVSHLIRINRNKNLNIDPWYEIDIFLKDKKWKTKIDILFNEFWEYTKSILNEEDKIKFSRVMGYDMEFNKVKKLNTDFNPLLDEDVIIKGNIFNPKEVIAYLWDFCKDYQSENLCHSLVMSLIKSVQKQRVMLKDEEVKDYVVCNPGKIQNMIVATIQGRLKYDDGSVVMIDNENILNINEGNNLSPADIYLIIKPFYDEVCIDGNKPKNANDLFKRLFIFIENNNLQEYVNLIIETVCLYSENVNGFNINIDMSLASCYEDMFPLDDYILAKEYINSNYIEDTQDQLEEDYFYDSNDEFNYLQDFGD